MYVCLRAGVWSLGLKACCFFFFWESLLGFPEFSTAGSNFEACKGKEKLFELRVMKTCGEGGVYLQAVLSVKMVDC